MSPRILGRPRPFLRWAGGKRQLAPTIASRLAVVGRYFEPFLGGGAVFFELRPPRAVLSDANAKLITAYVALRDDPESVITRLQTYENSPEFYKRVAAKNFDIGCQFERAADFIYCNRVNFNGLYRVNKKGRYNVPYGRNPRATICDAENLRAVSAALRGVDLRHADFEAVALEAAAGDVCYFDPPYVPLSTTSDFSAYTAEGFSLADQERLRDLAIVLKARGVRVVISNSSAPLVRDIYRGFDVSEVEVRRSINSRVERRGPVGELLIT